MEKRKKYNTPDGLQLNKFYNLYEINLHNMKVTLKHKKIKLVNYEGELPHRVFVFELTSKTEIKKYQMQGFGIRSNEMTSSKFVVSIQES